MIPGVIFWLMAYVAASGDSMAAAPLAYWSSLRGSWTDLPLEVITEEAFCTARNALPVAFFRSVFEDLVTRHRTTFGKPFLWRGFRLRGIDGTRVDLPAGSKAIKGRYPPPSNQRGPASRPQMLLVALVDLWTGFCEKFITVPVKKSEQFCARWLLRFLEPADLLLADKYFVSVDNFRKIAKRGAQFLMRMKGIQYTAVEHKKTRLKSPDEWLVDINISNKAKRSAGHAPAFRARVIRYQIKGFRPSYLVTSLLDSVAYPAADLVSLYHERWRQETFYRELKHDLRITNLRSHSVEGLLKEVYVQLTLNNAIRWTMHEAARLVGVRPVDLSFGKSKRLILSAAARMAEMRPVQCMHAHTALLKAIARQKTRVRPGRSYPRKRTEGRPRYKGKGIYILPSIRPGAKGRTIPTPVCFDAHIPDHGCAGHPELV
jgi:hypothetical protein